eukprot:CAMPEP_0114463396 /NCGR_PEP_ID=MMETSP0104-20121206/7344_1 /TAXON_ID=37642 ORGANISM="Paraphysomonas imperforata, Strain PA2" /NCGR_SAMPLE_ID=MMETSP0104 /ASSEMBLY_ACC=CAM_ASM_000202 /LENGTH=173 /DNA_ID=CAMNT_0001636347 /DNA_START=399 /DNA_END=916 /DNA_ORIENTATION=-
MFFCFSGCQGASLRKVLRATHALKGVFFRFHGETPSRCCCASSPPAAPLTTSAPPASPISIPVSPPQAFASTSASTASLSTVAPAPAPGSLPSTNPAFTSIPRPASAVGGAASSTTPYLDLSFLPFLPTFSQNLCIYQIRHAIYCWRSENVFFPYFCSHDEPVEVSIVVKEMM